MRKLVAPDPGLAAKQSCRFGCKAMVGVIACLYKCTLQLTITALQEVSRDLAEVSKALQLFTLPKLYKRFRKTSLFSLRFYLQSAGDLESSAALHYSFTRRLESAAALYHGSAGSLDE